MRESFEKRQPTDDTTEGQAVIGKKDAVEVLNSEILKSESFEEVAEAVEAVEDLQGFRFKTSGLPFGSFWEAFEAITNLNKTGPQREEKGKKIGIIAESLAERVSLFSPRVADFYHALLAEISGEAYEPHFEITREKIDELKTNKDLDVLFAADISWQMKFNRIETRFLDYLKGARALDKREGQEMEDDIRQWREGELKKAPKNPPQRRNESQPGVDPMERLKEGERVAAIWSINPAWGGYYKEQSFSQWDNKKNVWSEKQYEYSDIESAALSGNQDPKKGPIDIIMQTRAFAGQWLSLPVPYTHSLHKIEAAGRGCQVQKDQNGDLVIFVEGKQGEEVGVEVSLAAVANKKFKAKEPERVQAPDMASEFSVETETALKQIAREKRGHIDRAKAIKRYVVKRIAYLAPKDREEAEHFNNLYKTSPKGFAGAVDELLKGDCDVVNTYFAALCAKLDIPVRHCIGHSVKGKDEEGRASIHSGTGHGWSEVWDEVKKEWVRVDATPAGDPNLEESEEEKNKGDSGAPGDYGGGQEAIRPTDEQLEALKKKLLERKEKLNYTKEERQLAEAAGVELKEARQIVKEINEAEQTRLPDGELVVDGLTRIFNAIIESRKTTALSYEGPVRKREGGEEIEDIVRHKIGILTKESDPLSRAKPKEEIKTEDLLGGFDVYIISDKSGSMQSEVDGEACWKMQRRAIYLIFSSLHRFERNLERANLQKEKDLSVRTQAISFRGDNPKEDLDTDKPLSAQFSAKDKVTLWHSLTEQGSGNGDPEALGYVLDQIAAEVKTIEQRKHKDNRLRIIIACSDGGYIGNDAEKMRLLAEELHKLKAVVVGMGLTETAAAVPVVMENPPFSKGDLIKDINDLPALVAKHIILEAIKLFPEKAEQSAQKIIASSIAKFKQKK